MNWQNVTVKLSDLQPWEHNPRTMTKRQAQRLLKSWKDLGQFQTIAIGPRDNGSGHPVYDGHQRLSALLAAYGAQYAIDARQSDRALTEDERRYLITQANLPVGAWRFEEIAGWPEAQEWGFDQEMLQTWNSDAAALATMLEADQPQGDADAEPQIDRAAELNEKWQVQRGDLWRIGAHRLLCGDSTIGAEIERVGITSRMPTFTDPPYGVDYDPRFLAEIAERHNKKLSSENKVINDDGSLDLSFLWSCDRRMVWGFPYIKGGDESGWIVWDKQPGVDSRGIVTPIEMASTTMRTGFDMVRVMWGGFYRAAGEDRQPHPTQKPIKVYQPFIESWTKMGDDVADYFAGSGPVLVACQNLQRKCRAIEISPNYCAVILERMATAFPGIEIERISEAVLTHGT